MSQLCKLPGWVARRQEIAQRYDAAFAEMPAVEPLGVRGDVSHAYHLYVIRLDVTRAKVFAALRAEGIGVNVHYIPVHLHPYYRSRFGYCKGDLPNAESAYERILTLPIYPEMSEKDVEDVILATHKVTDAYIYSEQ
jgi:perosamine synthetase